MEQVKAEVVTITPELAEDFLKMNTMNRKKDEKVIRQYADAMSKGKWILNGTPITISNDNILLDGQNRLYACVKSGVPFQTLFVWGIDKDAFKTIDIGKTRTSADVCYIGGIEDANQMSSLIVRYFSLCSKSVRQFSGGGIRLCNIKRGREEAFEYYTANTESCKMANKIGRECYKKRRLLSQSTVGGYALYLHNELGHSFDLIESFFMQVFTGQNITNPVTIALQDKLLRHAMKERHYTAQELTAYIHKAWNAFVTGKEIRQLKYSMEVDGAYIQLI